MAATKHTEGSWTADVRPGDGSEVEPSIVIVAGELAICELWLAVTDDGDCVISDEDRANAALILAAPDLYQHLSGILAFADFLIECVGIDPDATTLAAAAGGETLATVTITEVLDRARVALAKAEGGAA